MDKTILSALYLLVMVALIVILDLLFFQDKFWQRLIVNVGIVVIFAVVYFIFIRHSK